MAREKIIIMGAAGRDFHNFNVCFRDHSGYEVVAFTATQIPGIESKTFPPELAGKLYPAGIPIHPEQDLPDLIRTHGVTRVVFAYSDVSHEYVMHRACLTMAAGADFWLLGPGQTMLKSRKPVISVCAVRTGCGKSQTSQKIVKILRERGKSVAAVRHPMPYGNLTQQKVQRFGHLDDLAQQHCTIEEMEEYEPYLEMGASIFAGLDYGAILERAEADADIILWDGGNNDFPFYVPDLEIVVVDPHRAGHELAYFPGEVNFRRAQVIVINKLDTARPEDVKTLETHIAAVNPSALIVRALSPVRVLQPESIRGKRVIVVEDGPTLTHGEMKFGAGTVAARQYGAREILDPRPWIAGSLKDTFKKYPGIGRLIPAMGYSPEQVRDLELTLNASDCDLIIIGTPIDLTRVVRLNKPSVRVKYTLEEIGEPNLETVLQPFMK